MTRVCTVCLHRRRTEIDRALIAGESYRTITHMFHLSRYALMRHKAAHLPRWLVLAQEAEDMADADSLLEQASSLHRRTLAILGNAELEGEHKLALAAIREARSNLELLGRLMGELREETTINVLILPDYIAARSALVAALAPFPDARHAVVEALAEAERGSNTNGQRG